MRRQSRDSATESPSFRRLASRHDIVLVDSDSQVQIEVLSRSRWGLLRLIAGMVRANLPKKLALGLSTALAGALTGTAFGVLYSAVWQLGAALSPLRLAAVTPGAISGAVGSGLEDDTTVRRATYGYREQERWREVRRQEREVGPAAAG